MAEITLEYDRLGSRLTRIGDIELAYDRLGSRVCRLGAEELAYDRLGARLARIGARDQLSTDDVVALFFVLRLEEEQAESSS